MPQLSIVCSTHCPSLHRAYTCQSSTLSIRRRPIYRSDIKIAKLGFGDVKMIYPTSNGRRLSGKAISSPRDLNCIKNRYQCDIVGYIRSTSECPYRLLSKWYIYGGFSELEAICPPSNCQRRFSNLIPSLPIYI